MLTRTKTVVALMLVAALPAVRAEKTVFFDQVTGCEIWRITNAPDAFYTHTYVEIPSIDPTGRWVAFHERAKRTFVADLASGKIKALGEGGSPLWHLSKPVLFFWRQTANNQGVEMRADPATGKAEPTVQCPTSIRGTTVDGRFGVYVADNAIWRIEMKPGAKPVVVMRAPPGISFVGHMRHNPTRPWSFIIAHKDGERLNGPCFVVRDDGSDAHRYDWFGEYIGHQCWAADGSGMLRANVPWPAFKPFPLRSDTPWRTLSVTEFWPNHIGCLGKDARLVATDNDNQSLYVTDTLTRHSSRLCIASGFSVPYTKDGDPHAHGSPDGTKLQFDSCYDLRDHGLTALAQPLSPTADAIEVASTARFPDNGLIMIGKYGKPEFVKYEHKDATHFLGCTRGFVPKLCQSLMMKVRSQARAHSAGAIVTDYFGRFRAPGVRRGPDIYLAVVRDPAPPRTLAARRTDKGIELTWEPPALHYEIAAYRVERSSQSGRGFAPIAPRVAATAFTDKSANGSRPYFYRVISLERSGLESVPSVEAMTRQPDGQAPKRRLFIEAEACSFVGQGGPEFSSACYGRTYVASESSWLAVPFELSSEAKCAIWLRVRTRTAKCAMDVWLLRPKLRVRVEVKSEGRFSWQRLNAASGQPLLIPAAKGANAFTLCCRGAAYDLDRVCITDDLDFTPPDEPNAKLPAPQVKATPTSPYDVQLTWDMPGRASARVYEVRDAQTHAVIAETQERLCTLSGLRPNSERSVQVVPVSRFGTPGAASDAVLCRPSAFKLEQTEVEAESCELRAPVAAGSDPAASGGKFVHVPYRKSGVGSVSFAWNAPAAGEYLIAARTRGYWPTERSLALKIDDGEQRFFSAATPRWQWQPATSKPTPIGAKPAWEPVRLSKGPHALTVSSDADGLLLDKLLLTNDAAWRPEAVMPPAQLIAVQTMPRPGAEVLIQPKGVGYFSLRLTNLQPHALSCRVAVERAPSGLTVAPREASAALEPDQRALLRFEVEPDQPGAQGHVRLTVRAGKWREQVVIPVRALTTRITLLHVEAERAKLPPTAKVVESADASGGKFVEFTDGQIELELDLPKDAEYIVWVRQFSPLEGFGYFANANGEFFRVVGRWEDVLGRWCWLTSPRVPRHHWPAGKLRLRLKRRGKKFRRVDAIVVTDDPDYAPGW